MIGGFAAVVVPYSSRRFHPSWTSSAGTTQCILALSSRKRSPLHVSGRKSCVSNLISAYVDRVYAYCKIAFHVIKTRKTSSQGGCLEVRSIGRIIIQRLPFISPLPIVGYYFWYNSQIANTTDINPKHVAIATGKADEEWTSGCLGCQWNRAKDGQGRSIISKSCQERRRDPLDVQDE